MLWNSFGRRSFTTLAIGSWRGHKLWKEKKLKKKKEKNVVRWSQRLIVDNDEAVPPSLPAMKWKVCLLWLNFGGMAKNPLKSNIRLLVSGICGSPLIDGGPNGLRARIEYYCNCDRARLLRIWFAEGLWATCQCSVPHVSWMGLWLFAKKWNDSNSPYWLLHWAMPKRTSTTSEAGGLFYQQQNNLFRFKWPTNKHPFLCPIEPSNHWQTSFTHAVGIVFQPGPRTQTDSRSIREVKFILGKILSCAFKCS